MTELPDPGEPIIEVRDLKKVFGSQTVLDGVNLRNPPGKTCR